MNSCWSKAWFRGALSCAERDRTKPYRWNRARSRANTDELYKKPSQPAGRPCEFGPAGRPREGLGPVAPLHQAAHGGEVAVAAVIQLLQGVAPPLGHHQAPGGDVAARRRRHVVAVDAGATHGAAEHAPPSEDGRGEQPKYAMTMETVSAGKVSGLVGRDRFQADGTVTQFVIIGLRAPPPALVAGRLRPVGKGCRRDGHRQLRHHRNAQRRESGQEKRTQERHVDGPWDGGVFPGHGVVGQAMPEGEGGDIHTMGWALLLFFTPPIRLHPGPCRPSKSPAPPAGRQRPRDWWFLALIDRGRRGRGGAPWVRVQSAAIIPELDDASIVAHGVVVLSHCGFHSFDAKPHGVASRPG